MSDSSERPADGSVPRDPWAPPGNKVPLEKNAGDSRPQQDGGTGNPGPPPVHDQQTVTSMPGPGTGPIPTAGFGPPDQAQPTGPWQGPGSAPPPPVGPNGPGQPAPPPAGQYGYPGPQQSQYGYPAPPVQQYPGYPGYGQNAWGGSQPANGLGTAAMVLGILSVCLFCLYGVPGVVLGVLALIFGILGRKKSDRGEADNGGQALAGIILGVIGTILGVLFIIGLIWLFNHADEFDDDIDNDAPYSASLIVGSSR
ncbi:DUF4190 domain-containing protein [Streptomyces sp. BE230]|uniref:DUF4190 domain-containing protein n=1 Tax=Streptomyces sp. BE230 TaxID=3002526 RepID=UPI002ED3EA37|nr:DUF4190 domain-containing protein [Streptomyces sp. BE230]